MVNFAAALEKEGISTFRFDFSGNGYGFSLENDILISYFLIVH